ncbi:MAG TPA: N-acyl homoserine lactonase family protein [Trebonia sp.]|nr:N-acyl homoserine lactonase family protein [Trebonia sp.]
MALEIKRLHLARLKDPGDDSGQWPVHGFVVSDGDQAVLVDTGVGGPQRVLDDWRVVNVAAADALAVVGLSPADITAVINTHLHFDHCGQNAVFRHAPFYVQRAELDRARREASDLAAWFDFAGARFELLDGDAEILPGLSVVATPGHTVGHQCVVVTAADGSAEVLIGDAAYNPAVYTGPADQELPPGQAADRPSWAASLGRLRSLRPSRVHFCHSTDVLAG